MKLDKIAKDIIKKMEMIFLYSSQLEDIVIKNNILKMSEKDKIKLNKIIGKFYEKINITQLNKVDNSITGIHNSIVQMKSEKLIDIIEDNKKEERSN